MLLSVGEMRRTNVPSENIPLGSNIALFKSFSFVVTELVYQYVPKHQARFLVILKSSINLFLWELSDI